ncbi:spore germination protein [Bacillus timonensis]|nr:spore germination protein [Bacillus timonensis]
MDWYQLLQTEFGSNSDVMFLEKHLSGHNVTFVYIDGFVGNSFIEDKVIPRMADRERLEDNEKITEMKDAVERLFHGDILIIYDDLLLSMSGGGYETRSIQEPENEATVRGPRDGFVESLTTNTSLLRRRYSSTDLKVEKKIIGERTKTKMAIVYIDGIVDKEVLEKVQKRIDSIKIDGILDSGTVEQWIEDSWYTPFPQVQYTERPDRVIASLLEGRIAIIVNGTPMVLLVPVVLSMLFQSPDDYYERWIVGSAVRFVRYVATMIALTLPSIYIALISFHPGLIPTKFAITIAATRSNVPFPGFLEALLMEFTIEMLREAGLQLPKVIGQTVGIVGGLVIGEAAVQAGIVSPMMVIVVAITGVSSFLIPSYNVGVPFRLLRFPLMLLAATLGLLGVILGLLTILAHLVSIKSFGINYFSPIAPYRIKDWKDFVVRGPLPLLQNRPEILKVYDKKRLDLKNRKKGW